MSKALDKLQTVFSKLFGAEKKMKGEDPCWKGYEMIGMKKKNGKDVPNCVPKNEEVEIAEAKVGDTVSFHHEMKAAPGQKVKKSGTVEKVDGDVVHVKVKDKYGVKRHQVKMSDVVKEEVELDEAFSDAQIARLKAEYSKISGIDPASASYKQLIALLDKQDKSTLQKLADSGIKFISGLARNRVIRMKEEVELEEQDSKHFEIYDTKTSKAVHSFKANHMSHANIKADDWLESNGKTGKGLKVRPVKQGVAEGNEPKLGTVKANLMNTKTPTVQVQVFKHNTLRGDSYWVTKEARKFKTMDQAQAYIDRINKQDVAEEVELDQLFTEAMKVKKKSEETSSKKSIKKGEPLSGKQEPVKMHPEVQTKN